MNSIITIDLHSDKIEKIFNIPIYNLDPIDLYLPFFRTYNNVIIVAPDKGSVKRAEKISNLLNIDLACITKKRNSDNNCEMVEITGDVKGKNCILIDDIIDSGETVYQAAKFLKQHAALSINAFITHGVLSPASKKNIEHSRLNNIYITDTIDADDLSSKFHIIPVTPIIVKALRNIL